MDLIAKEVNLSVGKYSTYTGEINFEYKHVSFINIFKDENEDSEKEYILSHFVIDTPAKIQQAYWTIWNSGRSRFEEDNEVNIKL